MARILYGVSPIGLGHATRALVVGKLLEASGVQLRFFSGGRAAEFLRSEGWTVDSVVSDPAPEVVRGEMKRASLWYLRSWLAIRQTTPRTQKIFDEYRPDLVVCDEEFSGISVASRSGCRTVFVSDELELGFAHSWFAKRVEAPVERWYKGLQESVDLLVVPEFGKNEGNKRFVEPIVRQQTESREKVIARLGLPKGRRLILVSMSGSGIGDFLVHRVQASMPEAAPDACLVIAGNRGPRVGGDAVRDLGVVSENQNLVAVVDLVVSTAGKSTIDEAASAGTPIVAIPIKHHAEQERNAASLGFSPEDADRLPELIRQKIGKREAPRNFGGGERTSRLIMSIL